ncbi:Ig-like domain-containing protein [Streptococcus acidominimus]|uniref:Ig-like domain-containing protein n=1 Tax=Streptococcus acidominimus TaxID=1326 RepID=UPI001E62C2B2|nr:Ig-like domain-containing protein [Streptococcus acidominimus]
MFVKNIFADEIQPSISNLTQEQVANTYRIAFDFDLQGLAAQPGDTFTITLPPELATANMLAFDVTQNGLVIGQAVPNDDSVIVTFNDAVTGDTSGRGSMAFNTILKTQPSAGETVETLVKVGNESIIITKTGVGPIPLNRLLINTTKQEALSAKNLNSMAIGVPG